MSTPRSAPPDLPGYTFVRGIGGGGFADVFLYQQRRPSRQVAIKVLRPEHLAGDTLRRFEIEADLMAQVSAHPYIVTIFAAEVAPDGLPFIVMEYYPQPHFGLRARGGTLPLAEVLRVGIRVCSAVETAHRVGILHRDIKPANILTSAYSNPGLTDFGIAGVYSQDHVDAAVGVSIAYAAPEVLADENLPGSVVADVYSLGATVYSLLAGRPPFWVPGGDNADHVLIARALGGDVPPVGRADVPRSLQLLLEHAMAVDPASRPPSAFALARALQDVEQALQLAPTPIEVLEEGEVRLTGPPVPAPGATSDDEDRTRRGSVQVIDPDGPSSPEDPSMWAPPSRPSTPPVVVSIPPVAPFPVESPVESPAASQWAPGASAAAPAPPPVADPQDGSWELTTHRRQAAAAPASAPADSEPARQQLPWALLAAGAACLVLVVGVVLAMTTGGGSDTTSMTSPAGAAPTLAGLPPDAPVIASAALDGDGELVIELESHEEGTSYLLSRTDDALWPDGESNMNLTDVPLIVTGLDTDSDVCFELHAINQSRQPSEPSDEECVSAGSES